MVFIKVISLLLLVGYIQCKPQNGATKAACGYQTCPKTDPAKLNVHLVPHSHDDVGWLKTVDQYFYGQKTSIQRAGVQYIIGSVVEALRENKDRRFIQVETAFFWQWWRQQSEETQKLFKGFVDNGQIEIINGAWSMNDEAATNYQSIIDQFTWGLKTINNTLGECGKPKIGWQIDPFGHSSEMANIFAQMGYEAVFFARLDYRDKEKRQNESNLELVWQGNTNLGSASNLFTSIFSDFYTSPNRFCWDVICDAEPLVDDESSPEYNIKDRVDDFRDYVEHHAKHYKTRNILIPMGQDFTFQAAEMYYTNIDKLIDGFNRFSKNITLVYSTPSCYLKAVNEEAKAKKIAFQLKTDDFFPYASDKHSYWSGYYTSRPNSKRLERAGNNILQAAKQLTAFEKVNNRDFSSNIRLLREAIGIMQHHDAITGTEKQAVAQDYARIVTKAIKTAESNISDVVVNLLRKDANQSVDDVKVELSTCLLANVTHCEPSKKNRFVVTAYNPLSRLVSHYIRLPVNGTNYTIVGPNNQNIDFDLVPVINNFNYVHEIDPSQYELVFLAKDIPAFGMHYYYVTIQTGNAVIEKSTTTISFGSKTLGFAINKDSGLLESVSIDNTTQSIKQEFLYYKAQNGTNKDPTQRASGAYVFRPNETDALPLYNNSKVTYVSYKGKLVEEVHQVFNEWVKQIIRIYKGESNIEFDWLVGPIPVMDDLGVEVITRFKTKLESGETFYTDSNGRQLLKRTRSKLETYVQTTEEPVSGNYYPVTSRIVIKDKITELAVLNDRAQGGSSLESGVVELMVHRHLLNDDAFGVGEALKETEFGLNVVARGRHFLTFSTIEEKNGINSAKYQRDIAQRKLLEPWVLVGSAISDDHTLEKLQAKLNFEFSAINASLPENVQILTLEPWEGDSLILRLEHTFAANEHSLSKNVTVNLKDLFTFFEIKSITETTIAANRLISEGRRVFEWEIENPTTNYDANVYDDDDNKVEYSVVMSPMQIRTFIVTYGPKDSGKGAGTTLKPLSLAAIVILLVVNLLT